MDRGKIVFTRTGSDEPLGEFPYSDGVVQLARVRLAKANNSSFDGENMARGYYALFSAAALAGIDAIKLPAPGKVTPEDVFELCTQFDAELVATPLNAEKEDKNDVNPTDTQAVSS